MLNNRFETTIEESTITDLEPSSAYDEVFGALPETIDFDIRYEPVRDHHGSDTGLRWVVRKDTDQVLHKPVGTVFNTIPHHERFHGVQDVLIENLADEDLVGVRTTFKTARNGEWALMDTIFPNVKFPIETRKHKTEIAMRCVAWSGVAGSSSNNVLFGAIDFFCTNGQISGEYDVVRKRNSTNFTLEGLLKEVRESKDAFTMFAQRMQAWAEKDITFQQADDVIEAIIPAERKQNMMKEVFSTEVSVRGANVWSLYSAFTNYASHEDLGTTRNTGQDTRALSMWRREQEVSKWITQPAFKQLAA